MKKIIICFFQLRLSLRIAQQYSNLDGSSNNINNPEWGSAKQPFKRSFQNDYFDKIQIINEQRRPSPRSLSLKISDGPETFQNKSILNLGLGQFLAHDMGFMQQGSQQEIPISLNKDDFLGQSKIQNFRAQGVIINGARQQINQVTSWIDATPIYGTNEQRMKLLRSFKDGFTSNIFSLMITDEITVLPQSQNLNDFKLIKLGKHFLSAGDLRNNISPQIGKFQALFLLEHNFQAKKIKEKFKDLDDEQLFQEARRRVIAIIQHITFNEYLPLLLGQRMPAYQGYQSNIFPNTENFFTAVSFRFGHANIGEKLQFFDQNSQVQKEFDVSSLLFKSDYITKHNIDYQTLFISLSQQNEKETNISNLLEMQNNLEQNLIYLHLMYNEPEIVEHQIISKQDNFIQKKILLMQLKFQIIAKIKMKFLKSMIIIQIKQILQLEQFINLQILCEKPVNNGFVGETIFKSVMETFTTIRDSDRFWYENDQFDQDEFEEIKNTLLSDIIKRNLAINNIREFVLHGVN